MKIFRYFFYLIFFIAPAIQANLFSISETQINHYLATTLSKKVKLQDSVGLPGIFQLDYQINDLHTQIGQTEEKRVEIIGNVDALLRLKNREYQAKIALNLDTVPYYNSEKGELFLKDVRLTQWHITPEKYQAEAEIFLPTLVSVVTQFLNNTPVYTLDETKIKEALIKKMTKGIVVEKGQLRLETAIF